MCWCSGLKLGRQFVFNLGKVALRGSLQGVVGVISAVTYSEYIASEPGKDYN